MLKYTNLTRLDEWHYLVDHIKKVVEAQKEEVFVLVRRGCDRDAAALVGSVEALESVLEMPKALMPVEDEDGDLFQ